MKVICVNNYPDRIGMLQPPLTVDKMYDVIDISHIPFSSQMAKINLFPSGNFYLIKGDDGIEKRFEHVRFRHLTIGEKRELKLQELGI
jgi:hypothetical protein